MPYNRKKFIIQSSLAVSALFLTNLEAFASPISQQKNKGFNLKIMAPYWGFAGSVSAFCARAKSSGYDGIEILWPADVPVRKELFKALNQHHLAVGFLCRGDEADPAKQLKVYKDVLAAAIKNGYQKPLYINVHSGKDFFTPEENQPFIDFSLSFEKETGVPIYHETHRSRMLFAAHVSKQYLQHNADLRITLDISHWCNVAESMLEDQPEAVALALSQTCHIHSRVGHEEGPQIGDPRAPEWLRIVNKHFEWWDKVVAMKKEMGEPLTMLTEFGPPTYMPTIPFTNKPVADQWTINEYMMNVWRKRYL